MDDEPNFTATLAEVLSTKGYLTTTASNGKEALAAVKRKAIDLALVDLKLPDIDGIRLLKRIKDASPDTEVIILTGHASINTAVQAMNQGAFGYLEKPYRIERLFLLIEKALMQRSISIPAIDRGTQPDLILTESDTPAFTFTVESGRVLNANPALLEMLGTGRTGFEAMSSDEFQMQNSEIGNRNSTFSILHSAFGWSLTDLGIPADYAARLKSRGDAQTDITWDSPGGRKWYRVHSTLSRSKDGTALALLYDITASRRREAENNRTRQYFEAVFSNLAAGIVIINSDYVIQQANPEFAKFFRMPPAELVNRKCHALIHRHPTPCHFHGEVCPIKNCLATGSTCRVQHRHRDARNRLRFIESTMAPLRDEADTIVSFVAIFADFTAIKTAQQEAAQLAHTSERKSLELERLNRELLAQQKQITLQADELKKTNIELIRLSATKDDFISMVSHELRTPLTAINEGISLVADSTLGPVSRKQEEFLKLALNNSRRLGDLINEILDLSKIEAGRMDLTPGEIDLSRLLNETAASFAAAARDKDLQLAVSPISPALRVYADERTLRRIMNNLLSNALKFTDHGSITISARKRSRTAEIAVADTGIGIPESEQTRIFRKFHQVNHPDGRRPPGTGLGLALTREMVRMNNGEISFQSREGTGTRFAFTLPLDNPAAPPADSQDKNA